MTYSVGDKVYILHDDNRRFDIGTVTGITPTGRINVSSICFTGHYAQFNKDGTLRGVDHHGGTHLVPVPEGTSTDHLEKEDQEKTKWLVQSYLRTFASLIQQAAGSETKH